LDSVGPFEHLDVVPVDENLNMKFVEWFFDQNEDLTKHLVKTRDKNKLEDLFKKKLVYGSALYSKYHK